MKRGELVYLIENTQTNALKIGYTKNIDSRIKQLQTGSSAKLVVRHVVPGDKSLEAALHKKFSYFRTTGEWFNYDKSIIDWFVQRSRKEIPIWKALIASIGLEIVLLASMLTMIDEAFPHLLR